MSEHGQPVPVRPDAGFTLAEMLPVTAIFVVVLFAVFGTTRVVSRTLATTERATDADVAVRDGVRQVSQLLRPSSASSLQVRSAAGSSWITPVTGTLYPSMRVPGAGSSFTVLEWLMDSSEQANDVDDDGDGLVDEGRLVAAFPGSGAVSATILQGVETCAFSLNGRVLTMTVECGRRDKERRVHRTRQDLRVYLRNN